MRDLVLTVLLFGLMPVCYRRPFVGLATFSWLAYMRVQDLSWGFARGMRWSYYVAIVTFAGFLVSRERKRWFRSDWRCYVMMLLVVLIGLGIVFSQPPHTRQVSRYFEYVKIVVIALFTTAIVDSKERLRAMLWVIALSFAFFGVKSGLMGIVNGGDPIIRGPGGMLLDNNDYSLALSMGVPLLFHLGWTERRPEIRKVFWFAVPLTVITIVLTRSRGGFLSIAAAIGVLVWRSQRRMQGIFVGILVAIAGLILMPDDFRERLATILEPSKEGSASSRLRAWGIATRMALDHPILGVGMYKFKDHFKTYAVGPVGEVIVAHSSYFQIWAECGTIALLLYFTLILGTFVTCWQVRAEAKRRYHSSWIINYATMFEAGLAAFVVGSTFLNRAHFDLFYHWVALVLVFGVIARREMEQELVSPVRTEGGRGELAAVERTGFRRAPRVGAYRDAQPARGA